jgi:hypothetical protein
VEDVPELAVAALAGIAEAAPAEVCEGATSVRGFAAGDARGGRGAGWVEANALVRLRVL